MDNNYHIPDLVQVFSFVENGLILKLHVAMILTTMYEQNKQT